MTHFCLTNNHQQAIATSRGFTMIEIVIAITIVSLIMTGIYGVFSTVSTTQKQLENESEIYHQARMIFDRIGCELRSSYLNVNNESSAFIADIDSNGNNYLMFTSTSALTNNNTLGGLVRVRYQLDKSYGKNIGRLLRSAEAIFSLNNQSSGRRLTSLVKEVSWSFFDGSNWQDNWDSNSSHRLPQSVEMRMTLLYNDREIQVLSAFDLSMARAKR